VIKLSGAKGSCRLSPKKLKVGTYRLVATYDGSTDFGGSASAKQTLTVAKTVARTTPPSKSSFCVGDPSKCLVMLPTPDDFDLAALTVDAVDLNVACPDPGVCDQPAGDQLDAVLLLMSVGSSGMANPGDEMGNFALILSDGRQARIDSITCDSSVEYALCGLGPEGPNATFGGIIFFDAPIGSSWSSVNFSYASAATSKVYVFQK
jgi:hypothetical protein